MNLVQWHLLFGISLSLFIPTTSSDGFYELLGVSRDADDRSIRRAFKKLAIQLHPDKNQDDPSAHEKFVRINRAYEILKDDELRKKYDLYGEDGLKDGANQQPQYQSWQFYKDQFGIYDDDPEIVTLNAHDFEAQVVNGRRPWFVNFYSAHCGHCHQLAPAWRSFARAVEGVIGVGAVNCLDEYFLCQQQRVGYYPLLIMYPEGQHYGGPRNVDDLVDYILNKLDSTIVKLTKDNYQTVVTESDGKPWIIDACDDDGTASFSSDCLSGRSRKLVSAALDHSITVGTVSCSADEEVCEKLGVTSGGIYYFPSITADAAPGERIESLDSREIISLALRKMPGFKSLDEDTMKEMIETGKSDDETSPWLVQFTKHGSDENLEYRLLPSMLKELNIEIGEFNCSKYGSTCQQLHLTKFPSFVLFKPNLGFEIHYGKSSLHDVLSFAKECAYTNVRTLSTADLSSIVHDTGIVSGTWFIDFFAPWCPPCMRLLPEFRKAAKILGDNGESIRFGTVDCTVNNQACLSANVHSYPTSILFNGSKIAAFVGLHNVQELVDFVEDIKNPPVVSLNPDTFQDRVLSRKNEEIWLVDFFSPHCGPCQQLAPEIRKLAKLFREHDNVYVADLDCARFTHFCQQQHIRAYPTIRVYPRNRGAAVDYNSWFRDVMSMRSWLFAFLPSRTSDLTVDDFYEVLNSDEPWLVDFFAPWCGHCQTFAPEYEKVAEALEGRVRVGKINCDLYIHACQSAVVRAYPTVRFYPGVGENEAGSQSAYGIEVNTQDSRLIVKFIEDLLRQRTKGKVSTTRDEL